jgi:multidrug transporter EmrE-like cation transporter
MICSVLGIPWFVAATVLSMNHVNSLKMESECAAPGEKPQFLGVREQRATHILIFVMIGLSVTLTSVLKHIPMPVLYGVFLYMGFASLKGMQFFDRILIMLPTKYQPDYMFLRQVRHFVYGLVRLRHLLLTQLRMRNLLSATCTCTSASCKLYACIYLPNSIIYKNTQLRTLFFDKCANTLFVSDNFECFDP